METLIKKLLADRALQNKRIINALRTIDRKDFVPSAYDAESYADTSLPIGYGQTISQPTTVAIMLELLRPKKGEKILDVGSGSGWTTALLAALVGPYGKVHGVERIPELVAFGTENLRKYPFANTTVTQAGTLLGLPLSAPYDRILVSAACEKIPQELLKQLKVKGTLVIPIESAIWKVQKLSKTTYTKNTVEGFAFVPLLS